MQIAANEISHLGPRDVGPFQGSREETPELVENLPRFGIGLDTRSVAAMFEAYQAGTPMLSMGMDADLVSSITTPSVPTPIQFLQEWLPGFVFVITQARKIDDLVGITTLGRWEDEEIVQGILEHTGSTAVYGDITNIPLSSWNTNFERRTVVRFEEGMAVGRLEEARAAAMRIGSAEAKRRAAAEALEITRNDVGFNGFNGGANRTFGFLNDPNLPAASTVSAPWPGGAFLPIVGDIRAMFAELRTQSGDRISPEKEAVTLALPTDVYDSLTTVSDFGNSVLQWLSGTYPNTRVVSAPQLVGNGVTSLAYLYAEGVIDESTDDRRTWIQVVPSKFQTLGVMQEPKRYVEDYTNATAGVMLKRPWAVVIRDGLVA